MKLIDLLVQELPSRGGWPEKAFQCAQDDNGKVCFYTEGLIARARFPSTWTIPKADGTEHLEGYSFYHNPKVVDANAAIITREQYEAALQQPVWDGEGLPPVACECDVIPHNNRWGFLGASTYTGVVIAYDGEDFWFKDNNGVHTVSRTDKVDFRPIRTEAERKRDEFITAIGDEDVIGTYITKDDAELIYDAISAGKIPGVKIETN